MASEPVDQASSPPAKKARTEEPEVEEKPTEVEDPQEEPTSGSEESENVSADLSGASELENDDDYVEGDDSDDEGTRLHEYTVQDFEGIELTEEQVAEFNKVYVEFISMISADATKLNKEPIMLVKAHSIRPVPTSVEEFEKVMTRLDLDHNASDNANQLTEEFLVKSEEIENEVVDAEKLTPEQELAVNAKICKSHIEIFTNALDKLPEDARQHLEHLLILSDALFETSDAHYMWASDESETEIKSMLDKVLGMWKAVLAKSNEELSITDAQRTGVISYLKDLRTDLLEELPDTDCTKLVTMLKEWDFDL